MAMSSYRKEVRDDGEGRGGEGRDDREGEGGGKEGGGGDRIGKGEALLRRQPIQVQSMDTLDALLASSLD